MTSQGLSSRLHAAPVPTLGRKSVLDLNPESWTGKLWSCGLSPPPRSLPWLSGERRGWRCRRNVGFGNREKLTSTRAPSGNTTRHQGLLSPRLAHRCRLPAPPQPARASLPSSLPFPTRNKQPAVPAAAARDANRAPGASPAGGGRRGAGSGARGTRELTRLPPRSGAGPGQGRRETGL